MNSSKIDQPFEQTLYRLPLWPVVAVGSLIAALFYGLLLVGPLDMAMLRRYCLSHPVAIASVWLFCIGIVGLLVKWKRVRSQYRAVSAAAAALFRLTSEGQSVSPASRVDWLLASWQAEPEATRNSWIGIRLRQTLGLQQSRGRRHQLETDLKFLAEQAADQQHESYALLRIIHWAMPMLGFLGTVLGISLTLGQLDTELLATQQQQAMNQLTSGLYVAFDTTAIALTLTVASMFLQFGVHRSELNLLDRMNREIEGNLIRFLAVDPFDAQDTLLVPVRQMASDLVNCVRELVVEQASVWSRSIGESQRQWAQWTEKLSTEIDLQLGNALGDALSKHLAGYESAQEKGAHQIECRIQQWQTTLSEQTRFLHNHQKELVQQATTLGRLVESVSDLRKLEESVDENLKTIHEVGQFEQTAQRIENATICVGEAVAMLATSLERAGLLRTGPQRPRTARPASSDVSSTTDRALGIVRPPNEDTGDQQARGKAA